MPDLIDESTRRLVTFSGGIPIVLADGQPWSFPRPFLEIIPTFGDNGSVETEFSTTLGPDFDVLMAAYESACDSESNKDAILCLMALAAHMLRLNYNLSNADLAILLRWRMGDSASDNCWTAIGSVARGLDAPKPSGDGSA